MTDGPHITTPHRALGSEGKPGPSEPEWLTPGVRGIGSASLLADVGHEIPTALLPEPADLDARRARVRARADRGDLRRARGAARFAGGALADDPQRRRAAAVGGYTTTAVLSGLIGVATNVWQVGVLRAGAWAARGLRVPARNALLADVVPARRYGRAYGFERAMDNLGAIIGPLLAIALVGARRRAHRDPAVDHPRACSRSRRSCTRSATPHDRHERERAAAATADPSGAAGPARAGCSPGSRAFELGNVAATLLILRATDLLEPGRGQDAAAQHRDRPLRDLQRRGDADQRPRRARSAIAAAPVRVLAGGVACFGLAYVGLRARPTRAIPLLAACFALAGIGIGCVETAEHAAVAGQAPEHLRGSAFGLLAAVQSLGNLVASAIAGLLYTLVSPAAAFTFAAIVMAVAVIALALAAAGPPQPTAE